MKEYPSIQGPNKAPQLPCIGFYKYDGSNTRFEWQKKRGWCKFGTRHQMFDSTHPVFGSAVEIFNETIAPKIDPIFKDEFRNVESVIVFCEFLGPNSFAGTHVESDKKELKLFDVNVHKKGILSPSDFVKLFGHLDISAQVVYHGNFNASLIQAVRKNQLETRLNEGIVCKGGSGHKLWMAKIKTEEYIERLKNKFQDKWQEYGE